MSIKAGAILFDANGFVIDRIQSGGPASLNIPEEKVYEVGNWESVGTVYDTPDLSFDLESYDVSPEFELLLVGQDPTTAVAGSTGGVGAVIDFQDALAMDILSPFKSNRNQFDIVAGVACPYLTLESVAYSFGVGASASQSFSLRGDSIYYTPGQPVMEQFVMDNLGGSVAITFGGSPADPLGGAENAAPYGTEYALNICLFDVSLKVQKRLYEQDMTSATAAGFTIPASENTGTTWDYAQVVWSRLPAATSVDYDASVHPTTAAYAEGAEGGPLDPAGTTSPYDTGAKPAAVRSKNINVYTSTDDPEAQAQIGDGTWTRLTGVQNFDATWSVTLENDEELGNARYVDQDYDVAEVSGSMTVKAFDVDDLFDKIRLVTNVAAGEVLGPDITDPIRVKIVVTDPADNITPLKSIYLPEARFQVPGFNPQVQTKLESQFDFISDTGAMKVAKGALPIT